jgi:hypothetical protein
MSSRVPGGFRIAALFAAGLGVMMLAAALRLDVGASYQPGIIMLNRALAAVLAALAGVAVEALWCARKWVYPASLALALAWAASVIITSVAASGVLWGLIGSFFALAVSATVVVPIVLYVRGRSAAMFGFPRMPVPTQYAPPSRPAPGSPPPRTWW